MNCSKILDMVYNEDSLSLINQLQILLHTFFCSDCAEKIKRFETTREFMRHDFFPPSPNLEDSIMAKIAAENEYSNADYSSGGLSIRGWVIIGLIVFISLGTVFFGMDFQKIADETGVSFLLPVGITIGIIVTTYGALFIGSHLKELTERFGL